MGVIETSAKRQKRRRNIQHAVLATVGVAGILAVAMIAPGVFGAIGKISGNKYKFGYRARTAAGRLAQKGLVTFLERDGKKFVRITEKGRRLLALETERARLRGQKRRRWDKQYRIVMFDIPERRKHVRKRLASLIRECGFLRLQDSVWIYPYDCEELVALMKAELETGKDILYAVVESIENDRWIKKHFNLA